MQRFVSLCASQGYSKADRDSNPEMIDAILGQLEVGWYANHKRKSPWLDAITEATTSKRLFLFFKKVKIANIYRFLVPEVGIEPTWSCPRGILSNAGYYSIKFYFHP